MTVPEAMLAIRTRGVLALPDVALLGVRGEDAQAALEALLPSRLFLRDAQVKESLLLDEAGRPIADVLVCADDEDFLLLVEGLDRAALRAHVEAHLPAEVRPELVDASETHEVISLHGPWAWHLVAAVLGEDMVALPYLNFFRIDAGLCVRAGKTGEYGYDLVIRRDAAAQVWASVEAAARAMDALEVDAATLSLCRFESWFFDPRFVPDDTTPLELQLSWRLDYGRDGWVGREAIDARRRVGVSRRRACLLAEREVTVGDPVLFGDTEIGVVTRAERSPVLDRWVVAAMLDAAWAHGGIDRYRVGADRVPVRTMAPPLIDNRSLYVDPRRHTWAARDELEARPLVRGVR